MMQVNKDNFDSEVVNSDVPVVVDFWAEWCGPCKVLGPEFEALSGEMDSVKFVKLNVDENQEISAKFGVMSIPTMILFKGGNEVDRAVGARPKDDIKKWIESKV